jgi:hypothetical protein
VEHITAKHRHLSPSFASGWNAASPQLRKHLLTPHKIEDFRNWNVIGLYRTLTWTSWPAYAYRLMDNLRPSSYKIQKENSELEQELSHWLTQKIDHEGSIFGLPPIPTEASYELSTGLGRSLIDNIAKRVVPLVLRTALQGAKEWLKVTVERDGVASLLPFLEGESLLRVIEIKPSERLQEGIVKEQSE